MFVFRDNRESHEIESCSSNFELPKRCGGGNQLNISIPCAGAGIHKLPEQSTLLLEQHFRWVEFSCSPIVHDKDVIAVHDGVEPVRHSDAGGVDEFSSHDILDARVSV